MIFLISYLIFLALLLNHWKLKNKRIVSYQQYKLPFLFKDLSRRVKKPLDVELWLEASPFIKVALLGLFFDAMLVLMDSIFACLSPTFFLSDST